MNQLQKYFYCAVSLMIIFLITSTLPVMAQNDQTNLVKNPGFEAGLEHWGNTNAIKVTTDNQRSGRQSLHYINTNPNNYKRFTQHWETQPGKVIQFSVWVKGRNVKSKRNSQGAGIYLQSYTADGTYITGSFPQTVAGTFDWTLVKGEYIVPENAVRVSLGIYLRKSVTGEVWFDDVNAHYSDTQAFISALQFPNYRGMVKVGDQTPWKMSIKVRKQAEWRNEPIRIATSLIDASGKVLFEQADVASADAKSINLTLQPPASLAVGKYILKQQIITPNGEVSSNREYPINVLNKMPPVYIDAQGFTVVNDERFFPLGIYTGSMGSAGDFRVSSQDVDLRRMADAGFNTVLSYAYARNADVEGKEFLDIAQKNHMHVIYSLKDMYDGHAGYPQKGVSGMEAAHRHIQQLKDHPALLAWYTNDEMKDNWLEKIQNRYNQIIDLNSTRPVYIVSNAPDYINQFYTMTDVLGTDPYPLGVAGRQLSTVTEWTKATVDSAERAKSVWQVLQAYNPIYSGNPRNSDHTPNLMEMRNMTYQAIINGSKGLLYYAYHWLFFDHDANGKRIYNQAAFDKRWPDMQKLLQEMKAITPVILEDHKVDVKVLLPSDAIYQTWCFEDKLYILVANISADKTASLQLQIPQGWQMTEQAVSGVQVQQQSDKLQIELTAVASGVVTLKR